MLQELGAQTGGSTWAIASMVFFIVFYVVVTVRVFTTRPEEFDARARLALEGDGDGEAHVTATGTRA